MTAITLALQMTVLMCVGYFARRKSLVDEHFAKSLASFIYNIVFPCVVVRAMVSGVDADRLADMGFLLIASLASMGLFFLLGVIFNKITRKKDAMSRILIMNLMFVNFTYMAFPVMEELFGEVGSLYIAIYTTPVRILFYIVCPLLLTWKMMPATETGSEIANDASQTRKMPAKTTKERSGILRVIFSPPVIAVPVGLLIAAMPFSIPSPIMSVLSSLAGVATPMGMALCGITLANLPIKEGFRDVRIWVMSFLRLLVAPAIVLGIFLLLRMKPLPMDSVAVKVAILYCALPAAASTTVITMKVNSDSTKAAQCVFITTVLSVLTLPIWVMLLNRIF